MVNFLGSDSPEAATPHLQMVTRGAVALNTYTYWSKINRDAIKWQRVSPFLTVQAFVERHRERETGSLKKRKKKKKLRDRSLNMLHLLDSLCTTFADACLIAFVSIFTPPASILPFKDALIFAIF